MTIRGVSSLSGRFEPVLFGEIDACQADVRDDHD